MKSVSISISVELFGIPRLRAGVSQIDSAGATLGEVLSDLALRYPQLGEACISGMNLKAGYAVNLRGEQFVTDPSTELKDGDVILLLSLDAGG